MKKIVFTLCICFIFLACSKNKNSKNNTSVLTNYSVTLHVGNTFYNTSNYSMYSSSTSKYQWDGLNLYFSYPACGANNSNGVYQVLIWDTAGGAIIQQEFLQFDMPGVKNFTNYFSPFASIYLLDTLYSGYAFVSAAMTNNGNHTCSGTFNLQGTVASSYSADSISFSAVGNFTNAPYY